VKKRTGEPWMPAAEYGRSLPALTLNLIVRDVARSTAFYRSVLGAEVRYEDPDFAALRLLGVDFMLHADHAYEANPWAPELATAASRGLGAEIRLLGLDPREVERRALAEGYRVVRTVTTRGHGWQEVMVADPDGYVWAAGKAADA
jgi:catechol 2,3-dioxygenase-like lactoylglutathione lyase family enzyme